MRPASLELLGLLVLVLLLAQLPVPRLLLLRVLLPRLLLRVVLRGAHGARRSCRSL